MFPSRGAVTDGAITSPYTIGFAEEAQRKKYFALVVSTDTAPPVIFVAIRGAITCLRYAPSFPYALYVFAFDDVTSAVAFTSSFTAMTVASSSVVTIVSYSRPSLFPRLS